MRTLWDHQQYAVTAVPQAIADGHRRICLTSPTGGGKTDMMMHIADTLIGAGKKVAIYTHRRLLIEQLAREFDKFGLDATVRAPGYDQKYFPLQISSIQTAGSRILKRQTEELHRADLVIFDEAHCNCGPTAVQLMKDHLNHGATVLGITATPLDIDGLYEHLIVAGKNSELVKCGALVKAVHYGPDEPDMKHFAKELAAGKDLSEKKAEKAMMSNGIFGRVVEWFKKLNPEQKPTILFAPSVGASLWFAQQFYSSGISAGHIDGEEVWINGEFIKGDARAQLADGSRDGSVKVVCNRFVLREGVNWPWLAHGILATVFGSLQSYLQSGGRLLRAHPGLDHVCVARGTPILTDAGLVQIQDVTLEHRIWDGIDFVAHNGAVCNGQRSALTWDGLTATPEHKVHTDEGWTTLAEAFDRRRRLSRSGFFGTPLRLPDNSNPYSSQVERPPALRVEEVWDIVNCGPRNRYTANGRLVGNCICDHGGNWWRHGSLNADRHWALDLTSSSVAALRADEMRQNPTKQPIRCPQCGAILLKSVCSCGFEVHTRSRPVVQLDGTLKEMKGDVFRPRRIASKTMEGIWISQYHRAKRSKNKMTFFQAEALFAYENNWAWPDRSWRMMPFNHGDMAKQVWLVPPERLR